MTVKHLTYSETKSFSELILNYLSKNSSLKDSYHRWPSVENFESQIREKSSQEINRDLLVEVLHEQYENLSTTSLVKDNIELLALPNTFTVATGHQLCLFTGPLYFLYKILSTINLAEELRLKYPNINIVPVFWMATEDHDFDEISQVNIFGKKWVWEQKQKGAVGNISTESLKPLIDELAKVLGATEESNELLSLFEKAYLNNNTLVSATRYLINAIFSKYGLVVLDANAKKIKGQIKALIKADIVARQHKVLIDNRSNKLPKAQAYAREINFFYMIKGVRERIEFNDGIYRVVNTNISFSESEILELIEECPERFSPNVLMRPLYKELILPNLAMVGGGAEVNYWMQLKDVFVHHKVVFPILLLRNSLLLVNKNLSEKISNLGFTIEQFFMTEQDLQQVFVRRNQSEEISLALAMSKVEAVYDEIALKTNDPGLKSSVQAEKKRQLNSLKKLEQKLRRQENQKHKTSLQKISSIKSKLFPEGGLQERYDNFSHHYLSFGNTFLDVLKNNIKPLSHKFTILIED